MAEFRKFNPIPRLYRDVTITEKIDGTNACVVVSDDGQVTAQSRNRAITREDDNYGFAAWVNENAAHLRELGPGYHYGEWWGSGIQRKYGLTNGERRFSLFNTSRWTEGNLPDVPGLSVVPVVSVGVFTEGLVARARALLVEDGSLAAPGFFNPEGIVIFHHQSRHMFKYTFDGDGHKGAAV